MQYRIGVHVDGYVRLVCGTKYRGADVRPAAKALALMCREHSYPRALIVALSEVEGRSAAGLSAAIAESSLGLPPAFRLALVSPAASTYRAFAAAAMQVLCDGIVAHAFHQEREALTWLVGEAPSLVAAPSIRLSPPNDRA
jgi:hypothetical protein